MEDFEIRSSSRAELDLLLDWASQEGWNPGLHDALAFGIADPFGFLIGLQNGRPIAGISAVRYPDQFAFLGLYIVVPESRGQGYGKPMWDAAIKRLEGHRVGLDGVVAQQANYRKSGFVLAHRNIRFAGVAPDWTPRLASADLRTVPFDALAAYDAARFGAPRPAFLAAWCGLAGHRGQAVVADGKIQGFAVLRPCRHGFKFGPLFANDLATAEALVFGLSQTVAGQEIFLDVPEPNQQAIRLAEGCGLRPMFETARMYLGQPPELNLQEVFGITSFELG